MRHLFVIGACVVARCHSARVALQIDDQSMAEVKEFTNSPRCCCFKGRCSEQSPMTSSETELLSASGEIHCCKHHWGPRMAFMGCDVDYFEFASGLGVGVDAMCRVDCSSMDCNSHGIGVSIRAQGTYQQSCECKCDSEYNPDTNCRSRFSIEQRLQRLAGTAKLDYIPEVSFPLDTSKYSADDLAKGPYAQCQILGLSLEQKPIEPNALLPSRAIVEIQNKLRPTGALGYLNAMAHCGLRLFLGGDKCKGPSKHFSGSIFLEHLADINAREWGPDLAAVFHSMYKLTTVDLTGMRLEQDGQTRPHDAETRGLTVFEFLYELFSRDPDVQKYNVAHKNCCHFARAAASVLLRPEDMPLFSTPLQNPETLDDALESVLSATAGGRKALVAWVASSTGTTPKFEQINSSAVDFFNAQSIHRSSGPRRS